MLDRILRRLHLCRESNVVDAMVHIRNNPPTRDREWVAAMQIARGL